MSTAGRMLSTILAGGVAFFVLALHTLRGKQEDRAPCFIGLFFVVAITGMLMLRIYRDARRHRPEVLRARLSWLLDLGLVEEQLGDYRGYKGLYRDHFIRVHFEEGGWQRDGDSEEHALCILVYFTPGWRADGQRDMVRWRRLERALDNDTPGPFHRRQWRMQARSSHLLVHIPFRPATPGREVTLALEHGIDTIVAHGFEPLEEAIVDKLVRKDPQAHGPHIPSFEQGYRGWMRTA